MWLNYMWEKKQVIRWQDKANVTLGCPFKMIFSVKLLIIFTLQVITLRWRKQSIIKPSICNLQRYEWKLDSERYREIIKFVIYANVVGTLNVVTKILLDLLTSYIRLRENVISAHRSRRSSLSLFFLPSFFFPLFLLISLSFYLFLLFLTYFLPSFLSQIML